MFKVKKWWEEVDKKKLALWGSIGFAVVVLGVSGYILGGKYITGSASKSEIEEILVKYMETNLPDSTAEIKSVKKMKGESLFEVELVIDGQPYTSYLSKSGNWLFPNGISLEK